MFSAIAQFGNGGRPLVPDSVDIDRLVLGPLREPTGRSVTSPAQASRARTDGIENWVPLSCSHGSLDGDGCDGGHALYGAVGYGGTETDCTDKGVPGPLSSEVARGAPESV